MQRKLNIVGEQIRKLRKQRGWTQNLLVARLQVQGWLISRVGLAKLETGRVQVNDWELMMLAKAFRVGIVDVLPNIPDPKNQEGFLRRMSEQNPPRRRRRSRRKKTLKKKPKKSKKRSKKKKP